MSKNAKLVILLLIIAAIIAAAPLLMLKGATFGGSDDAGSQMVNQIEGNDYTPWDLLSPVPNSEANSKSV